MLTEGAASWTYVDVDSLLRWSYGKAMQGAGFGHTKVGGYPVLLRGLSPLVATIAIDTAPVIAGTRLRGGNGVGPRARLAGGPGAGHRPRDRRGQRGGWAALLLRDDSAFYTGAVVCAARRAGAGSRSRCR